MKLGFTIDESRDPDGESSGVLEPSLLISAWEPLGLGSLVSLLWPSSSG